MSVIYVLLPFALLLGLGFAATFIWMAASGQYDDLETPAHRMLLPDPGEEILSRTTIPPNGGKGSTL